MKTPGLVLKDAVRKVRADAGEKDIPVRLGGRRTTLSAAEAEADRRVRKERADERRRRANKKAARSSRKKNRGR